MANMEEMHDLTGLALSFLEEVKEYVKNKGYILLQDEPIIDLRSEECVRLTVTQPIYIGESDIELTVACYLEEGTKNEMVVEATFDSLLPDTSVISDIHELLKEMRGSRATHFFICIKGKMEDGFCEDEISVVIRQAHRIGNEQLFKQWDQLVNLFGQALITAKPVMIPCR